MFTGAYVAVVTPFKDGQVDYDSLGKLIEFHIENGINGIVPCGSTGESATLSHKEHEDVIRFTVEKVNKRVPVMAGSGSNNTAEAIQLTQSAKDLGADGALLISPYYNKPTQKGIYEHYKAVADNVDIPIVLYNVPGRTGSNVEAATTVALSKVKNIVGMKEASGDLVQISEIIRDSEEGFVVLSGEDSLVYPTMAIGGHGSISVTANIAPSKYSAMVKAANDGDFIKAKQLHLELLKLNDSMFMETNPIPVKEALAMMGYCSSEVRLPLSPMEEANKEKLKAILKEYALI